ncbi:4386_t:CDS:2 [Paraglomus occultum]|uniref:4386_t:CDS:1 n=1 Tax=Paraglomus occultum TaxID=144539 RepID=A0A9N8VH31_9GLOM|nr:4386_t:CDS:2 [Paraglomus occultum]
MASGILDLTKCGDRVIERLKHIQTALMEHDKPDEVSLPPVVEEMLDAFMASHAEVLRPVEFPKCDMDEELEDVAFTAYELLEGLAEQVSQSSRERKERMGATTTDLQSGGSQIMPNRSRPWPADDNGDDNALHGGVVLDGRDTSCDGCTESEQGLKRHAL